MLINYNYNEVSSDTQLCLKLVQEVKTNEWFYSEVWNKARPLINITYNSDKDFRYCGGGRVVASLQFFYLLCCFRGRMTGKLRGMTKHIWLGFILLPLRSQPTS